METITGTSNSIDATFNGKFVIGNTAGGNVTATLVAAAVLGDGFHVRFKKSAAANVMTIALAGGSDLIDGAATAVLTEQYDETDVYCDGANFWLGGRRVPFGTNAEAIAASKTTVMVQPAALEATLAAKTTLAGLTKAGGLQLLAAGNAAGATLDIVLTSFTAYRAIRIVLINLFPASDGASTCMRTSRQMAGRTTIASAGNYAWTSVLRSQHHARRCRLGSDTKIALNRNDTANQHVSNVAAEGGISTTLLLVNQTATGHRASVQQLGGTYATVMATPVRVSS